jgi:hypothetical protein
MYWRHNGRQKPNTKLAVHELHVTIICMQQTFEFPWSIWEGSWYCWEPNAFPLKSTSDFYWCRQFLANSSAPPRIFTEYFYLAIYGTRGNECPRDDNEDVEGGHRWATIYTRHNDVPRPILNDRSRVCLSDRASNPSMKCSNANLKCVV